MFSILSASPKSAAGHLACCIQQQLGNNNQLVTCLLIVYGFLKLAVTIADVDDTCMIWPKVGRSQISSPWLPSSAGLKYDKRSRSRGEDWQQEAMSPSGNGWALSEQCRGQRAAPCLPVQYRGSLRRPRLSPVPRTGGHWKETHPGSLPNRSAHPEQLTLTSKKPSSHGVNCVVDT